MQRRRLRLLIPDPTGTSILVDRGDLPRLDVELGEGETTTAAVWRRLPAIGLRGPVLDCLVDQTGEPAADGVAVHTALVELDAPPHGWHPPAGWSWTPLVAASPTISPGLVAALADRIAELRGDRAVPANRVPWAAPGWYERARAWIERVVADAGSAAPTAIVQTRHWGISAVMRVDTPDRRLWFKAASGPFVHEPAITDVIHRALPDETAAVVAIDTGHAWMLLDDMPGTVVADDRGPTRHAFDRLERVRHALADRRDELIAAGCPHRPLSELPDRFRRALAMPVVAELLSLTASRVDELLATLTDAVVTLDALGVAETFVHGDFHPGNAMQTTDGVRLFDWSDAAISHPIVDVATWASWFPHDPAHVASIWQTFHAARHAADPGTADDGLARIEQRTLDAVAGAYHVISYAQILDALEPHRRSEHADGVTDFFALLDAAAPRTSR